MAYADYRLCDVCGRKVFYDANLNYGYYNAEFGRHELDYLGDWAVICKKCAETQKCVVVPRDKSAEGGEEVEMSESNEMVEESALREVARCAVEMVRRAAVVVKSKEDARFTEDGMIDVGGGVRRYPEEWVSAARGMLNDALKDAPEEQALGRMAEVCVQAMFWDKAAHAFHPASYELTAALADAKKQLRSSLRALYR